MKLDLGKLKFSHPIQHRKTLLGLMSTSHNCEDFKMVICDFFYAESKNAPKEAHPENGITKIKCSRCRELFATQEQLSSHMMVSKIFGFPVAANKLNILAVQLATDDETNLTSFGM